MYGTILHAGLPSERVRAATYDKLPFRDPALRETVVFDYGPGRRVIVDDDWVWLFHSERDPWPVATLARLADRARMEFGEIPRRFGLFSFRSDLRHGVIHVTYKADVEGAALFLPEYGYVERIIGSARELEEWLGSIDDVAHVELRGDGVVLGGRRFDRVRTPGANLDDVAALYQSHRASARNSKEVLEQLKAEIKPVGDAYEALVDGYNAEVRKHQLDGGGPDVAEFDSRLGVVKYRVSAIAPGVAFPDPRRASPFSGLFNSGGGSLETFDGQKAAIERVGGFLNKVIEDYEGRRLVEFRVSGRLMPSEPGFSLDPVWDVPRLVADLKLLLERPGDLVARAMKIVTKPENRRGDPAATPVAVTASREVLLAFPLGIGADSYRVPERWREPIAEVLRNIAGLTDKDAEAIAVVPILRLERDLKSLDEDDALRLGVLIQFLRAQHQVQQARYDGPLKGTNVGMVLFYTDLLAKLWMSVDYYRQAPVDQVMGFPTAPRLIPTISPLYWREMVERPNTRLWFGPNPDGYKRLGDSEVNFAQIATRVYAAGSDDLAPGKEELPAEDSRMSFGWWDRHFAQIADFEPAYHIQNQIMKWSVITGLLASKDRLVDLDGPAFNVDRTHRFDRWYRDHSELKFHAPIPLLPEDHWPSGTETLERLRSYSYPYLGSSRGHIEGGVSLGSGRTLGKSATILPEVGKSLRRAGIDYSLDGASAGKLTMATNSAAKGATFELPSIAADGSARVAITPSEAARLRAGPSMLDVKQIEVRLTDSVADRGAIRVGAKVGSAAVEREAGLLEYRRTGPGVDLDWRDGSLASGRQLAEEMARLKLDRGDLASRLAQSDRFGPEGGHYVVDTSEGPQVLAGGSGRMGPPPGRGGVTADVPGAPDPRGPPWLIRPVAQESAFSEDAAIRTASAKSGPNPGSAGAPSVGFAEARAIDPGEAAALLEGATWQRLRPLKSGGRALKTPGRVERVFMSSGPDAKAAKQVTFRTPSGDVTGYIQGDAIFLERPVDAQARASFYDMVTDHRMTSEMIDGLLGPRPPPNGPIVLGGLEAVEVRSAAVGPTLEGRPAGALKELASQAQEGKFDEALNSYASGIRDEALKAFAEGRSSPARDLARSAVGSDSADDLIYHAIESVDAREFEAAAGHLTHAMAGDVSRANLDRSIRYLRDRGADQVIEYINLKRGLIEGVTPEALERVHVLASGDRLTLTLELDPAARVKIPRSEIRARVDELLARGPVDVYVEDAGPLNKLDFDGAPGPSLSVAMQNADVQWERLDLGPYGKFRPSDVALRPPGGSGAVVLADLAAGRKSYHRYRLTSAGPLPATGNPSPIAILVRPCVKGVDPDCDDDDEQGGVPAPR